MATAKHCGVCRCDRFGVPLPVEVRYDDFTDDVLANQLVKAAADHLGKVGWPR